MPKNAKKKLIIIYGPTTSGKTTLAIRLAKIFKTEIISADSIQVYRDLDIGSGKFSASDKIQKFKNFWRINNVKINLYSNASIRRQFSAYNFYQKTTDILSKIFNTNDIAIVAGGTGLYIRTLLDPLSDIAISPNTKLRKSLESLSISELQQKLEYLDFKSFKNLNNSDLQNSRRLIRAIEKISTTTNLQNTKKLSNLPNFDLFFIVLNVEPKIVNQSIDLWYKDKIDRGLIAEVENLKDRYSSKKLNTLGLIYRFVNNFLDGLMTRAELDFHLPIAVHRYAKRQSLWFRTDPRAHVYKINESATRERVFDTIVTEVKDWYNNQRTTN